MENLGNSCYMNSVVQVLFSQDEIMTHFLSTAQHHLDTCGKYSPECYHCQIAKLAIGLSSGEYSQKKVQRKVIVEGEEIKEGDDKEEYYQDGIRPGIFKTLIGKGHEEFQSGRQ